MCWFHSESNIEHKIEVIEVDEHTIKCYKLESKPENKELLDNQYKEGEEF